MAPILTIRWEGTLALVSLGSSENRLDDQMVFQLHAILDECQSKCSGLILFAEGKFFSNGHDAEWMQRTPHAKCIAYLDAFYRLLRRLLETSYPVICAINGHAFGAGLLLALCADYRVMRRDRGWLCLNEVEMNDPKFQPGIYGSADRKLVALVRRKVPASLIQPMILEAKRVTASDALSAGLVDVIGATEELLPLAREHARKWERLASSTYGVMKKELYRETIDVLRARL